MTAADRAQLIAIAHQAEALELMAQGIRRQIEAVLVGSPALPSIVAREPESQEPKPRHYGSKPVSRSDIDKEPTPTTSTS